MDWLTSYLTFLELRILAVCIRPLNLEANLIVYIPAILSLSLWWALYTCTCKCWKCTTSLLDGCAYTIICSCVAYTVIKPTFVFHCWIMRAIKASGIHQLIHCHIITDHFSINITGVNLVHVLSWYLNFLRFSTWHTSQRVATIIDRYLESGNCLSFESFS